MTETTEPAEFDPTDTPTAEDTSDATPLDPETEVPGAELDTTGPADTEGTAGVPAEDVTL